MKTVRTIVLSLIVGALFGWVFSTKFPLHVAALSGTAAAAFMYAGIVFSERMDRRERRAHRAAGNDGLG